MNSLRAQYFRTNLSSLLGYFTRAMMHLQSDLRRKYEIEAMTLGRIAALGVAPRIGEPVATQQPVSPIISPAVKVIGDVHQKRVKKDRELRGQAIGKVLSELKRIKPEMHTEFLYEKIEKQHLRFVVFKIAQRIPEVKTWIGNIQGRRDLVKLAQEIVARDRDVSKWTAEKDWKFYKGRKRKSRRNR